MGRFNRANNKICHVHFKGAKLDSKIGLYFTHRNGLIFWAKADLSDFKCTMDHFECVISPFSFYPSTRTMFSFLSGIYVYVIAWAFLGQDSGDSLGPTQQSDFAVSNVIGRPSR